MNLVLGIVLLGALAVTSDGAIPQTKGCRAESVMVAVTDHFGAIVTGARLELRLATTAGAPALLPLHSVTDDAGLARFTSVPCGTYDLVSTDPAFPSIRKRVDIDGTPALSTIQLQLGVPCDDETGPTIDLTQEDRVAILSDLLTQARGKHDVTVLIDDNIEALRGKHSVTAGLEVVNRDVLLHRSHKQQITYLAVDRLETKGGCVVARYWIGCAQGGEVCTLCCEGATFTYQRIGNSWTGLYFSGTVS